MTRKPPARRGDERTLLNDWPDWQRATVRHKCDGVSDADAHRTHLPSSPLMTMAVRWSMLHMIEETARHNGHLDAIRELTDGVTGM